MLTEKEFDLVVKALARNGTVKVRGQDEEVYAGEVLRMHNGTLQARIAELEALCQEAAEERDLDCQTPNCAGGFNMGLQRRLRATSRTSPGDE